MITQERLKEILRYDAETGNFHWVNPAGRCGRYPAGSIAGSFDRKGYRTIFINGRPHKAHRLAWLYAYGELPDQLDHINRVKSDNRLQNLRPANSAQNSGNVGLRSDNTSGYRGVSFIPKLNKYQARCHHTSIGFFDTDLEADQAAREFRARKYGEFAA